MNSNGNVTIITVKVDRETKRWLDLQVARRIHDDEPSEKRSIGAIVRDLIEAARAEAVTA